MKRNIIALLFRNMGLTVLFFGCMIGCGSYSLGDTEKTIDVGVEPLSFTNRPTDYRKIRSDDPQKIKFNFSKMLKDYLDTPELYEQDKSNFIQYLREGNAYIKFRIEPYIVTVTNAFWSLFDTNVIMDKYGWPKKLELYDLSGNLYINKAKMANIKYEYQTDSNTQLIPRPCGILEVQSRFYPYHTNFNSGGYYYRLTPETSNVTIYYHPSYISGIYRIEALIFVTNKYSDGSSRLTNLRSLNRCSFAFVLLDGLKQVPINPEPVKITNSKGESSTYQIWILVGQTLMHPTNNYLTEKMKEKLEKFTVRYLELHTKDFLDGDPEKWIKLRPNDMSLRWGGLFWIGTNFQKDYGPLNLIDGDGIKYEITYHGKDHLQSHWRIYAPNHFEHSYGMSFDMGKYDYSNKYELNISYLNKAADAAKVVYRNEVDHYHCTNIEVYSIE